MKLQNLFPIFAMLVSAPAFADAICSFEAIAGKVESSPCGGSFTVPDNGAMSSEITCSGNGYVITVDCDLHARPRKLSLAIVGPSGNNASTSNRTSLSLVDENGNGAAVHCQIQ